MKITVLAANVNVLISEAIHCRTLASSVDRFYEMLRPGGRLLISDYCRAEGEPSTGFAAYIQQRGYHLHSVQRYGELIESAGFSSVMAEDRTWQVWV